MLLECNGDSLYNVFPHNVAIALHDKGLGIPLGKRHEDRSKRIDVIFVRQHPSGNETHTYKLHLLYTCPLPRTYIMKSY